jgi:ribosome-associated heat shock protein Hsp15
VPPDTSDHARLDKWLWAARFYKTRSLAAEAIEGGKVEVNGDKPKRARNVRPGDRIRLRLGPYEHLLTVQAVSDRRGPAAIAATLYEEDPEGKARRERLREQHRLAPPAFDFGEGKPSKKQRRDLGRMKRGDGEDR